MPGPFVPVPGRMVRWEEAKLDAVRQGFCNHDNTWPIRPGPSKACCSDVFPKYCEGSGSKIHANVASAGCLLVEVAREASVNFSWKLNHAPELSEPHFLNCGHLTYSM